MPDNQAHAPQYGAASIHRLLFAAVLRFKIGMSEASSSSLLVMGLCAQWCGTCRNYQPLFDSVRSQFAGRARFLWVDIEDHADCLGSIEVENFPTLLMACPEEIRFFGVLLPHRNILEKTIEHALHGPLVSVSDPEVLALAHWAHSLARSEP
ncbi:MAG: thioredoxin domain-containing protein [Burkholderiales bacterium]